MAYTVLTSYTLFSDTSSLESDLSGSSEASKSEEEREGSSCNQHGSSYPCDFGLNGDNLDWIRRPSIYSLDKDTESIHWFNLLAYDNRVLDWNLNDKDPIKDVMDLESSTFIPSPDEHAQLKDEFVILVLRILTKHCKYFQQFANIVPAHIPHQYSNEMSRQSQVVSTKITTIKPLVQAQSPFALATKLICFSKLGWYRPAFVL